MPEHLKLSFRATVMADEGYVTVKPVHIFEENRPVSVDIAAGDTDFIAIKMNKDIDYGIAVQSTTKDVVPILTLYDRRGEVKAVGQLPLADWGYNICEFDPQTSGWHYLAISGAAPARFEVYAGWSADGVMPIA
ncbi:MAG: hypothetical protein HQL38_08425 [Alphaproteobacteria bacterium]|nr:hypothetical protein [Alphaproteobacteria bacterium]